MSAPPLRPSGVSPGVRKYVWESMLDGEMNDRYWRLRGAEYAVKEKALKIFLGVTSSGTVAGWAIWKEFSWIWQVLSGISAVVAVALPILDYTGMVERASDLRMGWWKLTQGYNRIWAGIDGSTDASVQEEIKLLKEKEVEMSGIEVKFSRKEALIRKCQQDVLRARGISSTK